MKFTQPFTVTQFWTETTFKVSLEDSDAYSFLQGNCPSHIHLKITSQEDRWRLQSPQSLSHRCGKHVPQAVSLTLFTKAFPTASICDGTKNLYSENSATEALLKKKSIFASDQSWVTCKDAHIFSPPELERQQYKQLIALTHTTADHLTKPTSSSSRGMGKVNRKLRSWSQVNIWKVISNHVLIQFQYCFKHLNLCKTVSLILY